VFDALLSPRPWRSRWPLEEALAYIRDNAGKLFDPQVVRAFEACQAEVVAIHHRFEAN
jgi:putative two-component system response regulator